MQNKYHKLKVLEVELRQEGNSSPPPGKLLIIIIVECIFDM